MRKIEVLFIICDSFLHWQTAERTPRLLSALFFAALSGQFACALVAFAMLRYWLREAAEVAASYHSAIGCFRLHRVAAVICKQNVGDKHSVI